MYNLNQVTVLQILGRYLIKQKACSYVLLVYTYSTIVLSL